MTSFLEARRSRGRASLADAAAHSIDGGSGAARGRRAFILVALAVVAFVAVATLVRTLVPWPGEYGMRAKWAYFKSRKDEYDAVFIGSSRIFRGIDPQLFDKELGARGIAMHSFNFGVGGMQTFEMDFVLHEILALEPKRLRWVFFEGGEWLANFDHLKAETDRAVFCHSPIETLNAFDSIRRMDAPLGSKIKLVWRHVQMMLSKLFVYGQGLSIVDGITGKNLLEEAEANLTEDDMARREGFEPLEEVTSPEAIERHQWLVDGPDAYRAQVENILPGDREQASLDHYNFAALTREYEAVHAHGAELVYLIPPGIAPTPERLRLHEAGHIPLFLHFNRPDVYPELFRVDRRQDMGHLNTVGARALTRLVAQSFAELLEARSRQ